MYVIDMLPRKRASGLWTVIVSDNGNKSKTSERRKRLKVIPTIRSKAPNIVAGVHNHIRTLVQSTNVGYEIIKGLRSNIGNREDIQLG